MLRKRTLFALAILLGVSGVQGQAAPKGPTEQKPDVLKLLEEQTVRGVSFDVCYPADEQEYDALGKNAVVMATAYTVLPSELPLRTAYVTSKGIRVPLQRIAIFDKHERPSSSAANKVYTEQVSFYLMPIYLMKKDAELAVDFAGPRRGFGVTTYSEKKGLDPNVPAFIRLDDYDAPSDPDTAAVRKLLQREYPDFFKAGTSN